MSGGLLAERIEPARGSGPRLAVRRVEGVPVVAVRVWLPGGAEAEPAPGVSWAAGQLLVEGTRDRTWRQIADDAERRGAGVFGFSAGEVHGLGIDALSEDWERALDWAFELLLESSFPEDRVRWVGRQGAADLASQLDRPDVAAAWAFLDQLYAPHPRCRPPMGTRESLATLEPGEIVSFHRSALQRGPIVSVAGRLDVDAVEARLGELAQRFPEGPGPTAPPPRPEGLAADRREIRTTSEDQAHLYLGHLTVPRLHPDHPALELASVVLGAGGGLSGRIPFRLRDQEGLGYSVSATLVGDAGSEAGRLVLYLGTSPDRVGRGESSAREELERLREDGVTEDELASARTYLEGREPFRRETARQWAIRLAESLYWDLPLDDTAWRLDRFRALGKDEVDAAIRRHVRPDSLRVTVGWPEDRGADGKE